MDDGNLPFEMAKVAMKAHCYKDGISFIKESLKAKSDLTKEEIDVFSRCFKKYLNSSRDAIQTLDEVLAEKEKTITLNPIKFQNFKKAIEEHRQVLVEELTSTANDVLMLIDSALIPTCSDSTCSIYLNKLKGDYYRYLAEFSPSNEIKEGHAGRAKAAYEAALLAVNDQLLPSDPLYLALMLNYSVFQYEILGQKEDALDKLDSSFNDAVRFLEDLDETQYKESTMMLQLIRDNVTLWRDLRQDETNDK